MSASDENGREFDDEEDELLSSEILPMSSEIIGTLREIHEGIEELVMIQTMLFEHIVGKHPNTYLGEHMAKNPKGPPFSGKE